MKKLKLSLLSLLLVLGLVVVFKPLDVHANGVSTPKSVRGTWMNSVNPKKGTFRFVRISNNTVFTGAMRTSIKVTPAAVKSVKNMGYTKVFHAFLYRLKLQGIGSKAHKFHYAYVVRAKYKGDVFIVYASSIKKMGNDNTVYANHKAYGV